MAPPQRDSLWGEVELFRFVSKVFIRWCSKIFWEYTSTFQWAKKFFEVKKPKMTKKIDFEFQKDPQNCQKCHIFQLAGQYKNKIWPKFKFAQLHEFSTVFHDYTTIFRHFAHFFLKLLTRLIQSACFVFFPQKNQRFRD